MRSCGGRERKPTVILWKKRYAAEGIGGLEDRPRPGKPRTTDDVAIVLATLEPHPPRAILGQVQLRACGTPPGASIRVARAARPSGCKPVRLRPRAVTGSHSLLKAATTPDAYATVASG